MLNKLNLKKVILFVLLLISNLAFGQQIEMADKMRESGKIYVVVAVLVTVFIGIIIYLIAQERRLKKIEKELGEEN
jgi:membrane protein DedA with SNARE-associated domain